MDAKKAKQIFEKGFKYTFWDEISTGAKNMPDEPRKKVSVALKSYQRVGISIDGKVDPKRLTDADNAATIVASVDAVQEPMTKIYKLVKADKHWKKAIENYGVMLTSVREAAEEAAKGGQGAAPAKGGAQFAVADVIDNIKKVKPVLDDIQVKVASMDKNRQSLTQIMNAMNEPGANRSALALKGDEAIKKVALFVMETSKQLGGIKGAVANLAKPAEINPTDKQLKAYTQAHTGVMNQFKAMTKKLEDEKKLLPQFQKQLDDVKKAKDALNDGLMEHQDPKNPKKVVDDKGQDAIREMQTAYKIKGKLQTMTITNHQTQEAIEKLVNDIIEMDGVPAYRLQVLQDMTADIKKLGADVKSAKKSLDAAIQGVKILPSPAKIEFSDQKYQADYAQYMKTMPSDLKKGQQSYVSMSSAFNTLVDTYKGAQKAAA